MRVKKHSSTCIWNGNGFGVGEKKWAACYVNCESFHKYECIVFEFYYQIRYIQT